MNYKNFTIITKIIINIDDFNQTNLNNDILSYIDDLFGDMLLPEGEEIQAIDIYDHRLLSILDRNKSAIMSHLLGDAENDSIITRPHQRNIDSFPENIHYIWPTERENITINDPAEEIIHKFFKRECIQEERNSFELSRKFMFYLCPQCARYFSECGHIVAENGISEECATKHCNGHASLLFTVNNDRIMEMDNINPPIISMTELL